MGEAALGRSTGPPAREGSLTLPRWARAAEANAAITMVATDLDRKEDMRINPPGRRPLAGRKLSQGLVCAASLTDHAGRAPVISGSILDQNGDARERKRRGAKRP